MIIITEFCIKMLLQCYFVMLNTFSVLLLFILFLSYYFYQKKQVVLTVHIYWNWNKEYSQYSQWSLELRNMKKRKEALYCDTSDETDTLSLETMLSSIINKR